MKKKIMSFSIFVCLLVSVFMNISCVGQTFSSNYSFFIELRDENGKTIAKKEGLEIFDLSLIDNYSRSKAEPDISLTTIRYKDSSEDGYIYSLSFYLGIGHFESTAKRHDKKFKKQMEKTGFRIVDKQGRYKTYEIYPLSNYIKYSDEMKNIIIKLEKK